MARAPKLSSDQFGSPRRPRFDPDHNGRACRPAAATCGLELRLDLDAPGARFVHEAGEVVEVDRTLEDDAVGDVAPEGGHFPLAAFGAVAGAEAALQQVLTLELL